MESAGQAPLRRSKGRVLQCRKIKNAEGLSTLNGVIRMLESNAHLEAYQSSEIFVSFSAAIELQLQSNDLISFITASDKHGKSYAMNIAIIKFGGERFTANVQVIGRDIWRCSLFLGKYIDVAVDAARCVDAGPDAFSHGAQIEFSVHHDQRSDVWIAERIVMIKAKRKRAKADDDAMDLVDFSNLFMNRRVVGDADETAAVRDLKILDNAMKSGYFLFMNQVEVQEQIDIAQHFDADQIGRNCLQLHCGRELYSCEQIENMVDRILLCRRNTEMQNVQRLVKKLEICREINSLRVLFTRSGEREEGHRNVLRRWMLLTKQRMQRQHRPRRQHQIQRAAETKEVEKRTTLAAKRKRKGVKVSFWKIPVALQLSDYDHFAKEWRQTVTEWNLHVEALRLSLPLMDYFTINSLLTLIDRINRTLKQAVNVPVSAKSKSSKSRPQTATRRISSKILQRDLMPHFRSVNRYVKLKELRQCLSKWEIIDESSMEALTTFDRCFQSIIPVKVGYLWKWCSGIIGSYQRTFCVLNRDGEFRYSKSGAISLSADCEASVYHSEKHKFIITTPSRTWYLWAWSKNKDVNTELQMNEWCTAINGVIELKKIYRKKNMRVPSMQLSLTSDYKRKMEIRTKMKQITKDSDIDFYDMFGLERYCEMTESNRAKLISKYRELAMIHHPDRGGSVEKMQQLNTGRQTLLHPELKSLYDIELRAHYDDSKSPGGWKFWSRWVLSAASALGGVGMIIGGIALAPVTAGGSLAMSVGGGALMGAGLKGCKSQYEDPYKSDVDFMKGIAVAGVFGAAGASIGIGAGVIGAGASVGVKIGLGMGAAALTAGCGHVIENAADLAITEGAFGKYLQENVGDCKTKEEIFSKRNALDLAENMAWGVVTAGLGEGAASTVGKAFTKTANATICAVAGAKMLKNTTVATCKTVLVDEATGYVTSKAEDALKNAVDRVLQDKAKLGIP